MPFTFKCKYSFFQKVYLITDPEQMPWIITGVSLSPNGEVYTLSQAGSDEIDVFEGEFTTEMDMKLKLALQKED